MITSDSGLEAEFTFENGGGREDVPEEFHVLFVGDWRGDVDRDSSGVPAEIAVDRDNFEDVMRRLAPRAHVAIGASVEAIEFSSLDDFHPDELFGRLPVFGELRELREKLRSVDGYESAAARVRAWFAAEPSVSHEPAPAALSETTGEFDLLDKILSDPAALAKSSPLDSFVSGIVAGHRLTVDDDERKSLIAAVDDAISGVMREILHSDSFMKLEAAWRGLWFAVRRFETDRQHRLAVVDLPIDRLIGELRESGDLAGTSFAQLLFGDRRYGAVAINHRFRLNVDDAAALIRLSAISKAAGGVAVTHVAAGEFGLGDWFVAGSGELDADSDAGKLWSAVRGGTGASSLVVAPNRLLGRLPYGAASDPTERFAFEEFTDVPSGERCVWLNPCFPLALLMALEARDGERPREFGRLPLASFKVDGEAFSIPCAEFVPNERSIGALLTNGLVPLIGFRDEDRVIVGSVRPIAA